jgi:aryl-alcohol dehydrogenase-like predicted oxidoreductase
VIAAAAEIAKRHDATIAQVALQWIMTHPEISVVITGADTAEQLDDNVGSVDLKLAADEIDELNRVSVGLHVTSW